MMKNKNEKKRCEEISSQEAQQSTESIYFITIYAVSYVDHHRLKIIVLNPFN